MHSAPAHLALMERVNCRTLLSAKGVEVSDILAGRPMPHFVVPDLEDLLDQTPTTHYPYDKTFQEAAQDPYLILHSSGSTGMPKPIMFTHGAAAALDARGALPTFDQRTGQKRRRLEHHGPSRLLVPFLHFHGISSFVIPTAYVFAGTVYIPGFRNRLATKDDIFNILDNARVDDAFLSPAMIEDIVAAPDAEKYLSRLGTLYYGGGAFRIY